MAKVQYTMTKNFDLTGAKVATLVIHRVGNKLRQEDVTLSRKPLDLSESQRAPLLTFLLAEVTKGNPHKFTHSSRIELNEVFTFTTELLSDPSTFLQNTSRLAKHLYEASVHPKIKGGELFCVLFTGIRYESNEIVALGLFKVESRDHFLKFREKDGVITLDFHDGAPLNSPDKGCLIFAPSSEKGLQVFSSGPQDETHYWLEAFLNVTPVTDDHFVTEKHLQLCREFSEAQKLGDDQLDKAQFLNAAISYFTQSPTFDSKEFNHSVLPDKNQRDRFNKFQKDFEAEKGVTLASTFNISKPAVKTAKRRFKTYIRLDTSIEVHLKCSANKEAHLVERGYDPKRKMHFYKLFFNQEF